MKLLLDTHVVLWLAIDPHRLDGDDLALITQSERLLSVASVWELAIKQGLGKVRLGRSAGDFCERAATELKLELLPISARHAAGVEHLAPHHRDPFDRLLIAQAVCEDAVLLTADSALTAYGDHVRVVGD